MELNTLHQLYDDYENEVQQVRKKASAFAGIFGMGDDPRKHPCHEKFYEDVDKWLEEFLNTQPASGQVAQVASFMLERPVQSRGQECYWFMYACIGYLPKLVPLMQKADCAALAELMAKRYPRRERMPVQSQVLKLLQKAGK